MSHQKRRGHLKIYLGYAAGVGKTHQMLDDAHELKARGVDVVLAFLEPQGRNDLLERSREFEMVPLLRVACRAICVRSSLLSFCRCIEDSSLDPGAVKALQLRRGCA